MKKIYCAACLLTIALFLAITSHAQEDSIKVRNANTDPETPYQEKGFKKENLFTGGGVTASFYSGGSVLGVSPVLGYKFNDYFDGGIVLNYTYSGARDVRDYNDKLKRQVFGPGVFLRAFPISFLFVQAQLEQNFINEKYTNPGYKESDPYSVPPYNVNVNAPSLLLGGGYATGRTKGSSTFFYVSILADVLKNRNSPYVDLTYDPETGKERVRITPIIKAGVNVGLFQGRYGRY